MDWFLYDRDLRHETVSHKMDNYASLTSIICVSSDFEMILYAE